MKTLLKNAYDQAEDIKGSRLVNLLVTLAIVFVLSGLVIGYSINLFLKSNEDSSVTTEAPQENSYVGYVKYDSLLKNDLKMDIEYKLVDADGAVILYLTSEDSKLKVVENMKVSVEGRLAPTNDGKNFMVVENLSIVK
jgi:cytochrome c-type biogenesis protein CcmE